MQKLPLSLGIAATLTFISALAWFTVQDGDRSGVHDSPDRSAPTPAPFRISSEPARTRDTALRIIAEPHQESLRAAGRAREQPDTAVEKADMPQRTEKVAVRLYLPRSEKPQQLILPNDEFTPLELSASAPSEIPSSVMLDVTPGVRLPVALVESATPTRTSEILARSAISAEFIRQLMEASGPAPSATTGTTQEALSSGDRPHGLAPEHAKGTNEHRESQSPAVPETPWNNARQVADEQYRALFGDAAYNEASMRATRDAQASAAP